jgi:hypothetical protein
VQPGKGCSENCVYCGGTRGMEQASFGRPTSFLRPIASVRRDHEEIAHRSWQLRYDFAGGTAEFLSGAWKGLDLSKHATTYFLWGVPPRSLIDTLAGTFGRVYLVLDVGCFSQLQRQELMKRGLLKPCPTDEELLQTVDACRAHPNLKLEVCAIAGLPHTSERALKQELPLVERLLEKGCDVGSQRLESQPGALVTQHADRFDMVSDASTFDGFVEWFAERDHASAGAFPMIRYRDATVEGHVERTFERVHETIEKRTRKPAITGKTKLINTVDSKRQVPLGDWLGGHRVPAKLAKEPLTVVRSRDGAGLACAPKLSERAFTDPNLQQGTAATAILSVLDAFTQATAIEQARMPLPKPVAREVIDGLLASGFLQTT